MAKVPEVAHILFLPQGVEIELTFALWAAISEIRADFQNCHIYLGMKLGKLVAKVPHTLVYSRSTPGGQNWSYFCFMGSGFRYTGQVLKLPYLGMKLGHWPKFQKLHTYSLSTLGSRNWVYFCSTGSCFQDTGPFSKLQYLGISRSCTLYFLCTPRGWNWAYFSSMGSGFRDTGHFSQLPYLGMKLGKWPKFQKLHIYTLSTPGGRNLAYFCSMGSGFRDMG